MKLLKTIYYCNFSHFYRKWYWLSCEHRKIEKFCNTKEWKVNYRMIEESENERIFMFNFIVCSSILQHRKPIIKSRYFPCFLYSFGIVFHVVLVTFFFMYSACAGICSNRVVLFRWKIFGDLLHQNAFSSFSEFS